MVEETYNTIKHIRYEVESDLGKRVFVIPSTTSGAPDMENVLCLSDTSLIIWDLISQGKSNLQIIDSLSNMYQLEKEQIPSDVMEFISGLLDKKYITIVKI